MAKVKVKMDAATKEWFKNRPAWEVTTVQKCEKCGLFYKPELGHKCEKEVSENERISHTDRENRSEKG